MIRRIKYILIYAALLVPSLFYGQKKSDLLKRQEKKLLEKIEHTKELITQTRATKKLTLSEINIVNKQWKTKPRIQNINDKRVNIL